MKISCARLETPIELDFASPIVLFIENPKEYYKIVNEFVLATGGETSEFTFWNGSEKVIAEKEIELLTDIFTFKLTDKKIISLLNKRLLNNFNVGKLNFEFNKVSAMCEKFLSELCETEAFALEFDEVTLESLLKAVNIRPEENYETLLEKIICYLNILIELKAIKCVIFVGLKNVLSDDELRFLYRHCRLHKLLLLLIEGSKTRAILNEERAIIITEDLCEIVENF